ncbi:MAG TPA: ribonuclease III [Candidatus Scatomorpha stercorigallinarum]|nr:ribonuclease III [Candidatus Scatomorpha stercorigallinarum]
MNAEDIGKMSVLSLAHVGDAVYELLVRTRLAEKGFSTVVGLHRETVSLVKAPAQARAAAVLLPRLTEQEHAVYRRGRNSHVNSVPRGATKAEYHAATALEAVFGYLWLTGAHGRVHELFEAIMEVEDAT